MLAEGPLRVSKWIKLSFLVDEEEMAALFSHVSPFLLYNVQGLSQKGEGILSPKTFLESYEQYIFALKRGELPPPDTFRALFSLALSVTPEAFTTLSIGEEKQLIKPSLPIVQMQASQIGYSAQDHRFRTQVFGKNSISWGIQLGYPQIFQDSNTYEVLSVRDLPNTSFFHTIQKWIRYHTRATPFIVDNKKINEPVRLGKASFSWIHHHPQLKEQGISIHLEV